MVRGTMIQDYNLEEKNFRNADLAEHEGQLKGNNDVLNIHPSRPYSRHSSQVFGRQVPTSLRRIPFSSQLISQADYQLEHLSRPMALAGAKLARQAADEFSTAEWPRFVCGSVGPTNKTCSMSPDVSDAAARDIT